MFIFKRSKEKIPLRVKVYKRLYSCKGLSILFWATIYWSLRFLSKVKNLVVKDE